LQFEIVYFLSSYVNDKEGSCVFFSVYLSVCEQDYAEVMVTLGQIGIEQLAFGMISINRIQRHCAEFCYTPQANESEP